MFNKNFTNNGNSASVTTRWPYRSSVDEWRSLAMTHSLSCRGSPHFLPVATLDGQKFMEVHSERRIPTWCRCCLLHTLTTYSSSRSMAPTWSIVAVHNIEWVATPWQCWVETPWQFYRLGKTIFTKI